MEMQLGNLDSDEAYFWIKVKSYIALFDFLPDIFLFHLLGGNKAVLESKEMSILPVHFAVNFVSKKKAANLSQIKELKRNIPSASHSRFWKVVKILGRLSDELILNLY